MDMTDRLVRGFTAGIIAGIVQDFLDFISSLIKIDELTNLDWAGIAIYGAKPNNSLEWIMAAFGQLFLTGILGVIFAYLISQVTSKNLIIKGGIFGLGTWIIFFMIPLLFKIKELMATNADSAASDAVTSFIFGIVLALTLNWLDKGQKIHS